MEGFDPFEGIPPYDPVMNFDPLDSPPQVAMDKIMATANEMRSRLNPEQLAEFDGLMEILTSMGFGVRMAKAAGTMPDLKIGPILGLNDLTILAFVHFASVLGQVGIEAIVPKDHPGYDAISGGQLQMLMGLLVGYKLREEQEG